MAQRIAAGEGVSVGLPGRSALEVVAGPTGAAGVTFRRVEILPEAPGETPRAPHLHRDFEEVIHVLSGHGLTRAGDARIPVGPGDTLLVPAGEPHVTRNTGTGPLVLLCFFPVADIRPGTVDLPADA